MTATSVAETLMQDLVTQSRFGGQCCEACCSLARFGTGAEHIFKLGLGPTRHPHCSICDRIIMEEEQQTSRPLRRHPTKKDWTRLRPRAEQLYKVQKRKIDDVVEVLQEENGLRITERMFRKRAKEWNILKNRKEHEMKAVWRKISTARQDGAATPVLELHGEQISWADIREHFRKKLPAGQNVDNLPTPTRSQAPTPDGLRLVGSARNMLSSSRRSDISSVYHSKSGEEGFQACLLVSTGNEALPLHEQHLYQLQSPTNEKRSLSEFLWCQQAMDFAEVNPLGLSVSLSTREVEVSRSLAKIRLFFVPFEGVTSKFMSVLQITDFFEQYLYQLLDLECFARSLFQSQSWKYLSEVLEMISECIMQVLLQTHIQNRFSPLLGRCSEFFDAVQPYSGMASGYLRCPYFQVLLGSKGRVPMPKSLERQLVNTSVVLYLAKLPALYLLSCVANTSPALQSSGACWSLAGGNGHISMLITACRIVRINTII